MAAVIGRDFDLDLLARATEASEDELLGILDKLANAPEEPALAELLERLVMFRSVAGARVEFLRGQLAIAESFAYRLRRELRHGRRKVAGHTRWPRHRLLMGTRPPSSVLRRCDGAPLP